MPPAPKFREDHLKAAAAANGRAKGDDFKRLIHVRDTANLYLKTSAEKRKQSWVFRFSRPDGSGVTEMSFGPYPYVSLEEAKNSAWRCHKLLADKINPLETKDWSDAELTTFGEAAQAWLDSRKGSW